MGQAKLRGSLEDRKREAIYYKSERARLDNWLEARKPIKAKRKRKLSTAVLMGIALSSYSISPRPSSNTN